MKHASILKEISITELPGLRIGNAQDEEAKTGVTVLLFDQGAKVGIDISGGGPAARETHLTDPTTADNPINAIVLSGGSAYGLAASDGVMRYLEEHDIGYPTGFARVPLVCQSCIYDLGLGRADIRPDAAMGYAACVDADANTGSPDADNAAHHTPFPGCGSIGAGTGASVGKLYGMTRATKTGLGIYAVSIGQLKVAAVVVLNALGDIYNPQNGQQIAGLRTEDGTGFADTCEELYKLSQRTDLFTGNTTIGAVITNGAFSKAEMSKIASMTRCAYARCINPVGTMADGDSIYAASVGTVPADINMVGTLAAEVMAEAIQRAVLSC
ncbi:MAG: P1 family peptidase [Eubacteriales bacterium]|nr:P1 family peptidase [Eubacteriales bacterium]